MFATDDLRGRLGEGAVNPDSLGAHHARQAVLLVLHSLGALLLFQYSFDKLLLVQLVEVLAALVVLDLVLLLEDGDLFLLVGVLLQGALDFVD